MAGALHKTMVYLGLAEDEHYDDDQYDEYDDAQGERSKERTSASRPVAHGSHAHGSTQGGQVTTLPQRPLARVVAAPSPPGELQRITTIHPRTYNEAKTIGEAFREGTPVIMNLTDLDDSDAKRLVDFAAGLVFGLHGAIERVTSKVFLLSPAHVEVVAEDKDPDPAPSLFNQS